MRWRSASRVGLGAGAVVVASLAHASAHAPALNWAQFRGNARLTGVAASPPPDTLTLKWTFDAGDAIESSAAVVDGTVYVGSAKGELLAIDFETGKRRWAYSTVEGGFIGESSPTANAEAVFIGDLAGVVHAGSVRDGKPIWAFKTSGEIPSAPVLLEGLVLLGAFDTHLYAVDAATGHGRGNVQAA